MLYQRLIRLESLGLQALFSSKLVCSLWFHFFVLNGSINPFNLHVHLPREPLGPWHLLTHLVVRPILPELFGPLTYTRAHLRHLLTWQIPWGQPLLLTHLDHRVNPGCPHCTLPVGQLRTDYPLVNSGNLRVDGWTRAVWRMVLLLL